MILNVRIPNRFQVAVKKEMERQYEKNIQGFTQEKAREEVWKANEQVFLDMDAAVLYALHRSCGFGKVRLERFYNDFHKLYNELRDFYLFGDMGKTDSGKDFCWYADRELKKIGVDVKELQKKG